MGGLFGQPDYVKCCCGEGGCIGCCVPVADGTNAPLNIPFEISAPNCPKLDGFSGLFVPAAPPPAQDLSPCGVCGAYQADSISPTVDGAFYNPPAPCFLLSPPGFVTPIGPWLFSLHCDSRTPPRGSDLPNCCKRLLLGIARTEGGIIGDLRFIAPSACSCEGGLSAIYPLDDLIEQTWLDPGIFCPIDGAFPWNCDLAGATLVV